MGKTYTYADDCSIYLNESEKTSLISNLVYFKELDQGLKITPYLSHEVFTSLEKSTRGLLTIFNKLEREQKECSKCEEMNVRGRRN